MQHGSVGRLDVRRYRLENGLTVLVRPDRSASVVAIVTYVKAGYFDEPDAVVGISHVLEHMYFKGTRRRGAGELARATKGAGGYLNAGTIYDRTSYYTVLPADALELGLDLQSDALRNLVLEETELRKELEVIIQESNRKRDSPAAVATESLYAAMFDVHPMRRWRIGTEDVLKRLKREDVDAFYRSYYTPGNVVLALAGAVNPERARVLVDRYYADMAGADSPARSLPDEPSRDGLIVRELVGDIVQTHVEWGWRTAPPLHADTPALDLLAAALGHGRGSVLYQRVREAGLTHTVSAYNYTPTELGVFGISAELDPARTLPALRSIWSTLHEVVRRDVSAGSLERARSLLEARFLRRLETAEGQANLLAEWEALGDWRLVEGYLDALFSVQPADVGRVAESYLPLERATVLIYRPSSTRPLELDADDLAAELVRGSATGSVAGPPDSPGAGRTGTGRKPRDDSHARGPEPSPVPRAERIENGVHFYELPGARLAVLPSNNVPLVSIAFLRRGGRLREPAGRSGLASLHARASLKGTKTRSALQIATESELLGGLPAAAATPDVQSWTMTLPSRHSAQGLRLLTDVVLRPALRDPEVERERDMAISEIEQLRDDMYRYPLRLLLQAAFPQHPYGESIQETESGLRAITPEDVREWHTTQARGARPWLMVVGDAAPHDVAVLAAELNAPDEPAAEPAEPAAPIWPREGATVVDRREKAQTALALAFPGAARRDPARYTDIVLSSLVSGLGGRFFEELRGRRSLAYAVVAYPISRWLAGAFVSYIATSPEREGEARRALLEQFERLASERIAEPELERAKNYCIGVWKIRRQTTAAQLAFLAEAILLGEGPGELREYELRIREVTPERIRARVADALGAGLKAEGLVRGTGIRG